MVAVAGSFGFPPMYEATTPAQRRSRRFVWAAVISIALHAVLLILIWTYRAELRERFTSDDVPVAVLNTPFPAAPVSADTAEGGESGAATPPPTSLPVHRTEPRTPPPEVSPFVPAPEVPTAASSAVPSSRPADGQVVGGQAVAGAGTGSGAGVGAGAGPGEGAGQGLGAGGGSGWKPRWIRLPSRSEARWFYPGGARSTQEGWAVIRCTITATGRAKRCVAIGQSGPGFGAAAVYASRYFKITPKEVDGRNVAAELDIRLVFYQN